jgi:hypothetical protein
VIEKISFKFFKKLRSRQCKRMSVCPGALTVFLRKTLGHKQLHRHVCHCHS